MVTEKSVKNNSVNGEELSIEYWASRRTEIASEMMTKLNNLANNQDPLIKYYTEWLISRSRRLFKISRQQVESEECEQPTLSSFVHIPLNSETESDQRCLNDEINAWKKKFEEERKYLFNILFFIRIIKF
ncbi:hypothetical protein Mgra_00001527 [Meloidogyne graminicola]|uniref:Uncharacterized protein n=1 Tax=Meloidogyne graminicola TaxID=189291 RepID=A0A8S9ZZ78_9BILA|nr:hypothetical protein Mgra_00001527 [Meloidogyne graminicola]